MRGSIPKWAARVVFWLGMAALTSTLALSYREAVDQLPGLSEVALSAGLLVVAVCAMACAWAFMQDGGARTDHAVAYVRSQVLKYLPLGGAAQAVAQVSYSKSVGALSAGGSYVGFLAMTIGSACLLVGLGALLVAEIPVWLASLLLGGLFLRRGVVVRLARMLPYKLREYVAADVLPSQAAILRSSGVIMAGFALFGMSFAVLLRGEPILMSIVAAIAAWLAGFLAVPFPSGVAVREVVLVSLLGGSGGADMVLGAVVVHRWVSIVSDIGALILMGLIGRIRIRYLTSSKRSTQENGDSE